MKRFWCTGDGVGKARDAIAKIRIEGLLEGASTGKSREKSMTVKCKKKYTKSVYKYSDSDSKQLMIEGTRAEMENYRANFNLTWKYDGTIKGQSWRNTSKDPYGSRDHPFAKGLNVGKYKSYEWKVSEDKWPTLHFQLRFRRAK